jgi:hypothetical protein
MTLYSSSPYMILMFFVKVKFSRYRPGVAQRVGRGIALLFHECGTRRWVSGQQHTPAALYPRGKTPVPILQEAEWAPGPVWTGAENLVHTGIRSWTVQPLAQSLYRLSYPAHISTIYCRKYTYIVDTFHAVFFNAYIKFTTSICSLQKI